MENMEGQTKLDEIAADSVRLASRRQLEREEHRADLPEHVVPSPISMPSTEEAIEEWKDLADIMNWCKLKLNSAKLLLTDAELIKSEATAAKGRAEEACAKAIAICKAKPGLRRLSLTSQALTQIIQVDDDTRVKVEKAGGMGAEWRGAQALLAHGEQVDFDGTKAEYSRTDLRTSEQDALSGGMVRACRFEGERATHAFTRRGEATSMVGWFADGTCMVDDKTHGYAVHFSTGASQVGWFIPLL